MIDAYVMIRSDLGTEDEILREIREIPEVVEVYQVYGIYEIILRIKAGTSKKLKEVIEHRIRNIEKVCSTLTMIIINAEVEESAMIHEFD